MGGAGVPICFEERPGDLVLNLKCCNQLTVYSYIFFWGDLGATVLKELEEVKKKKKKKGPPSHAFQLK